MPVQRLFANGVYRDCKWCSGTGCLACAAEAEKAGVTAKGAEVAEVVKSAEAPTTMRAISLWQPWATAIALNLKKVETRSWATNYRGPLAIHAAKKNDAALRETFRWPEFDGIRKAGYQRFDDLPFGAVVATCRLVDCKRTEAVHPGSLERQLGNYEPGRFGWILEDVVAVAPAVPFRGSQGFFEVPVQDLRGVGR